MIQPDTSDLLGACVDRCHELEEALDRVRAIRPEDHATTSRDYGRGFADAIHRVQLAIKEV